MFRPFFEDTQQLGDLLTTFKNVNLNIIKNIEPIGSELQKRKNSVLNCKNCREFQKVIGGLYEQLITPLIKEDVLSKLMHLED